MIDRETHAELEMATYAQPHRRMGFFTDTTLCIGCKACEVACKQWNQLPADGFNFRAESYDNTSQLDGNTWRHVAFIEQSTKKSQSSGTVDRWLMSSDVCKHCTQAACLDVCPTGSLIRTELGTVMVQSDICNGCGYCVVACPFGVLTKRPQDGEVGKCTLCHDRAKDGITPACAQACPTESIQYGVLDELRERADRRLQRLQDEGRYEGARLYARDPGDGIAGAGAFFLLLDEPEVYGLPPDPTVTTRDLPRMYRAAGVALGALVAASLFSMIGSRS